MHVCELVWGVSISIHALLAESDVRPTGDQPSTPGFLSTLSLRRATRFLASLSAVLTISIHALLAESDSSVLHNFRPLQISIHALLAESDGGFVVGGWPHGIFLSTLSLRRATIRKRQIIPIIQISIHALLAESDS